MVLNMFALAFAVLGYGIPKDEEEARKKLFMPFQARVSEFG